MGNPETLVDRYTAAIEAVDKDAMLALYAPEARVFDMTMPWEHRGREDFGVKLDEWFSHMRGIKTEAIVWDIEVRATDEMALLTMMIGYYDTNEQGKRDGMNNRLTWVAVPAGDDWLIVHEHTSAPLDSRSFDVVWEQNHQPAPQGEPE